MVLVLRNVYALFFEHISCHMKSYSLVCSMSLLENCCIKINENCLSQQSCVSKIYWQVSWNRWLYPLSLFFALYFLVVVWNRMFCCNIYCTLWQTKVFTRHFPGKALFCCFFPMLLCRELNASLFVFQSF